MGRKQKGCAVTFILFGNVYVGRIHMPFSEVVRFQTSPNPTVRRTHIRVAYLDHRGDERNAHVYPDAILEELYEDG